MTRPKVAIIAVAYNRKSSLERLLKSLKSSYYTSKDVDLFVSIDKSDQQQEIIDLSEDFNWPHGEKVIRALPERYGLRKHILSCGDISENYDAVVVFEDDIVAAPNYYNYVEQALQYYSSDSRIAGISLYTPTTNEMVVKPFSPVTTSSDVFFIQSSQSWGQCWTKSMWSSFRAWYEENQTELVSNDDMPKRIYSWPDSSWKKYHMKYIVETNKYFVYPYISLSTNFLDIGQHVKQTSSMYQVPLLKGHKNYDFISLDKGIKYDVFFESENINISHPVSIKTEDICVDLYGSKQTNNNKRYILTRKLLKYDLVESYGLVLRPQEENVSQGIKGDDLYLYDTNDDQLKNISRGKTKKSIYLEYHVVNSWKDSFIVGLFGLLRTVIRKVK